MGNFCWLLGSMLVVALSQIQIEKLFVWKYPALDELVVTEHYAQDLGAVLLGSRRVAADVAYIQLLQYYGTPEIDAEGQKDDHDHEQGIEEGEYPRLKELALRYLRLDPFFNIAVLEMAGALAFNQRRISEGTDYLREAIRRDSSFYRYHVYLTAILYKEKGEDESLMRTLEEAAAYPDCPALFRLVLGNLFKKHGLHEKAALIYRQVMDTAPQEHERKDAAERLAKLIHESPWLIQRLKLPS